MRPIKKTILFVLVFALNVTSWSATINIPVDYSSIQSGLDQANTGDTILVAPGTYYESIVWPETHDLQLLSSGGELNTFLISDSNDRNILFPGSFGYTSNTRIAGFTMSNIIIDSTGISGMGIFIGDAGSPTIEHIHFTNYTFVSLDSANYNYSGIIGIAVNSHPTITNCKFDNIYINNVEIVHGGIFYISTNCNPIISNIEISNVEINSLRRLYGGVFYITHKSHPKINNITASDFKLNTLSWVNGGIFSWLYGGGFYITDECSPTLSDIKINRFDLDSAAWNYGGGIHINYECNPSINNLEISNLKVAGANWQYGGAIYIDNKSKPLLKNVSVLNLKLEEISRCNGGTIYINDGSDCNFDSLLIYNTYTSIDGYIDGMGLRIEDSDPTFTNFTISDCFGQTSSYMQGGCLNIEGTSNPQISNFVICNNNFDISSFAMGAAISFFGQSAPTLTNGQVTKNKVNNCLTTFGAGAYIANGASPTFMNCTIADNEGFGTINGLGIYSRWDSHPTFINSIIRNSQSINEVGMDQNSTVDIAYSNIRGGYTGTGNIDQNPLFVGSNCYILDNLSPCFGTGNIANAPLTDVDGNKRPASGNSKPSMGAYENEITSFLGPDIKVCQTEYTIQPSGIGGYDFMPITVQVGGTYIIEGTKGCCSLKDTITISYGNCAGIIDNKLDFKIYPNPTSNYVVIEHTEPIVELEIYNLEGQKILVKTLTSEFTQVSLEKFSPGIYIVNIHDENGLSRKKKIVVQ